MGKAVTLARKTYRSLKEEGPAATARKIRGWLGARRSATATVYEPYMDVLFINGCDPQTVPHPPRYRVTHQREQLIANSIASNEVFYTALSLEQARQYRVFVFFRCPYTELIGEFIRTAKELHKTVLFDIDDLVIDTKYTDQIPYVRGLTPEEKRVYDDGVIRMGKTLSLCDAAITTTERLAQELRKYVPEVFINRNTASEKMLRLSQEALEKRERGAAEDGEGKPDGAKGKKKEEPLRPRDDGKVRIGYFSGSITHNADFEMILPAVARILKEKKETELHIVGELDLPEALKPYEKQVVKRPFVDWEKLPELIASVDINLAPVEETIFNEAKSENKWVEAALVKVPTVASDVGAFRRMIVSGETGALCRTEREWYEALRQLVEQPGERERIAQNAYGYCREHCVTMYTGFALAKYIRSKMNPNAAVLLPSLNVSGGVMVALKHARFLYEAGLDVFLINEYPGTGWVEFEGCRLPVVSRNHHTINATIDKAIATMWTTESFLRTYPNIGERYYLVQGFETEFYKPEIFLRIQANQSYCPGYPLRFATVSRWCQGWLKERFEQEAAYARNGIDYKRFRAHKREFDGEKVRILVEGDCSSHYKNVDESFKIVDALDRERFEIWYMSYNAEPKPEYRVDRFLHKVPFEKVPEVYEQCDILLKSSYLESFSYPPLEMMASGGYAVAAPNGGNAEYLRDGENCLLYPRGDIGKAVSCIERLCADAGLREKLYRGGLETAKGRDWEALRGEVLGLYGVEKPHFNKGSQG